MRTWIKRTVACAIAAVCVGYAWYVYDQHYGPAPKQVISRPNPSAKRSNIKPAFAIKPTTHPTTGRVIKPPPDPFNLYEKPGQPRRFEGHADTVRCLALSPDKTRFATAGNDRTVRLWDFSTGKQLRSFEGHSAHVSGVGFSPDGSRIISCSDDQTIRVWDANSGEQLSQLEGHQARVIGVAFLSDPNVAISVSHDGSARLWDIDKETTIQKIDYGHSVCSMAVSVPHNILAVGTHSGHVYLWDLKTRKETRELEAIQACIVSIAFSSNAKMLAVCPEESPFHVIDTATGTKLYEVIENQPGEDEDRPTNPLRDEATKPFRAAFSSDGRYLALARREVIFYDVKSFQRCKTHIWSGSFCPAAMCFVPDSPLLITVGGGYMYGNEQWLAARRDKVLVWNMPDPIP